MSWNDLPQELEEKVLSHLSLIELKHLIGTRKVCLAIFHEQLATEQTALCDIAIARYGRKWNKIFADLCTCLVTEGTVGKDLRKRMRQPRKLQPAECYQGSSRAFIFIHTYNERLRRQKQFCFALGRMKGLADIGWVAFLQAFLSVGMSGLSYRVQIICSSPLLSDPSTLAGVKAHIAPLLPLVAGFTFMGWGQEISVKGSMHAGDLGPDEKKGCTLQLKFCD